MVKETAAQGRPSHPEVLQSELQSGAEVESGSFQRASSEIRQALSEKVWLSDDGDELSTSYHAEQFQGSGARGYSLRYSTDVFSCRPALRLRVGSIAFLPTNHPRTRPATELTDIRQ